MALTQIVISLGLVAMAVLGCRSSPTQNSGDLISVQVSVVNTANAATILETQMFFDGVQVVDSPTGAALSATIMTATGTSGPGAHMLSVAITNQVGTSNTYTITPVISLADQNGTSLPSPVLTPQTVKLINGQQVTFNFVI